MTNHDIVAIKETSRRGQKPRVSIKLHLRGPGGGTHTIIASTPPFIEGDRRIDELYEMFRDLAGRMNGRADYLCSCPPPGETK